DLIVGQLLGRAVGQIDGPRARGQVVGRGATTILDGFAASLASSFAGDGFGHANGDETAVQALAPNADPAVDAVGRLGRQPVDEVVRVTVECDGEFRNTLGNPANAGPIPVGEPVEREVTAVVQRQRTGRQ